MKVAFVSNESADGLPEDLVSIVTTLNQGNSNVEMKQECSSLAKLVQQLKDQVFAMAVSTTVTDDSCITARCFAATSKISNLVWKENDALIPYVAPEPELEPEPVEPDTLVDAGVA